MNRKTSNDILYHTYNGLHFSFTYKNIYGKHLQSSDNVVNMKKKERLKIFKDNLRKLVKEGNEGSFVVFDATAEKFVQFAGSKEEELLICDIPLQELSKDEEKRLIEIEEFSGGEGSEDVKTGEQISYQAIFDKGDIERAADLTERIFIRVFGLPHDYDVSVTLNLE